MSTTATDLLLFNAVETKAAHAEAKRKRLDTLRAQLALRGFELVQKADATYIVAMSGLELKSLPDVDGVADFARQVGAAA